MSKSNIEQINQHFQNPLFYVESKKEIQEDIMRDLEINETNPAQGQGQPETQQEPVKPMHHYLYKPKTVFGKKVAHQMTQYYTDNVPYLKETQKLIKKITKKDDSVNIGPEYYETILSFYDEIKNDNGFKERYQYFDWEFLERFNRSAFALQISSVYHICSPVISLLIPFFVLLIPFFIIKMKGLHISFQEYVAILKMLVGNHAIGKLFCELHKVKMEEKAYIIISAAFYVFSIYQNIMTCIRFHSNMKKIHAFLADFKKYIAHTEEASMDYLELSSDLTTYSPFNEKVRENTTRLSLFKKKLDQIAPFSLISMQSIQQWGQTLECFYQLYDDADLHGSFVWSFGFHGYMDLLSGLKENVDSGAVEFAEFYKTKSEDEKSRKAISKSEAKANVSRFVELYYPPFVDKKPICNDVCFKKNIVLTGPNASGKTTILKSCLLNILFSQQVGCGFYKGASLVPYQHIHCYLNIPDTSGRDSLFQAEARRCKLILDAIDESETKDRHFCVFDELYSGTNPEEAVLSGNAFMKYLGKNKKVDCLLTTHFFDLCKSLEKAKTFKNFLMKTEQIPKGVASKQSLIYTYKMEKGISKVKGGVQVLTDMNYPREIIEESKKSA
jgi:energy-coupling factor transporter ATP-binding protein EcfA2